MTPTAPAAQAKVSALTGIAATSRAYADLPAADRESLAAALPAPRGLLERMRALC
ncbi:MAG TPA: hypothetical protein VL738_36690 [Dactylosporangium sp.]|jgi:hypothetical protein|nr:hypothetical protein [Dactylosporangium sp.]